MNIVLSHSVQDASLTSVQGVHTVYAAHPVVT
jgi:hypothetical protein